MRDYALVEFVPIFEQKTNLIKINGYYPSAKSYDMCGCINEKLNLNNKKWIYPEYNTNHDKDINATINICKIRPSSFDIDSISLIICQH